MSDPVAPRYCVDCAHYRPSELFPDRLSYARCVAPENTTKGVPSLVAPGDVSPDTYAAIFCNTSRGMEMFCGPDAKWFDEKAPANV